MNTIKLLQAGLAAAALTFAVAPVAALAAPSRDCFYSNQWSGWRSPSPTVIYLKVGLKDVYRVDLSAPSSQLQWPNNHLVSQVRGSNMICSALDLDLSIADSSGFSSPLFPKALTKLSPAEAAAIPPKFQP